TVFTGETDPQLVKEAMPFALKLYETLLEQAPDNENLLLATAGAFSMYAYAFVQMDAEKLPDEEIERKTALLKRAKDLYLRGRGYSLKALELRHEGFTNALKKDDISSCLKKMEKEDIPFLYWTGLSWMGAFSVDPFDMDLSITKTKAVDMLTRCLQLDETYDKGGLHAFFISFYGNMPPDLGGSEEKARKHFQRALELSHGQNASIYISLATSVSVKDQNEQEFEELLNKALEINVDNNPSIRLSNILAQDKARWLLEHKDNYFIGKGENEE
ncbi:MAG: TRAP transporter TatT component family protein, partial [Spirochaetes bacterium]|nr:TRAP transporter TatT component family protein [Spirochaetota bacterium]